MTDLTQLTPSDPWLLFSFIAVMLALNFTPGPAVFKVASDAMASGLAPAHASIAGVFAANFFYAVLAATGVAVLVFAFPGVLWAIKWLGLSYLTYLAIAALRTAWQARQGQLKARPARPLWRLFVGSFVLQVSNPTSLLSFGLMLPVFAGPGDGLAWRMIALALLSLALEYPAMLFYASLAAWSRKTLLSGRQALVLHLGSALFLALAVVLIAFKDFTPPTMLPTTL